MSKTLCSNLVGVTALSALIIAAAPALAANRAIGCAGDNMAKVRVQVETMPDGDPIKWAAVKEVAMANTAYSASKPGECAMHLSRAAQLGLMH
ncbi:MAG: hypothetical protein AB1586_03105 [Pseudomonadota bacterium]